jgi:hypothetical protein
MLKGLASGGRTSPFLNQCVYPLGDLIAVSVNELQRRFTSEHKFRAGLSSAIRTVSIATDNRPARLRPRFRSSARSDRG